MNRFIFPAPKPPTYNADSFAALQTATICWIPREDPGRKRAANAPHEPNSIPCLFFPMPYPGANRIMIFCHGNAEDLGNTLNTAESLREQLGVHVLSIEYPGYGISTGDCSETALINDLHSVWTFLTVAMEWPTEDILLFGFSIGTGPTTALASTKAVGGLVLLAPYTSIKDMVEVLIPKWGIGRVANMFLSDRFVNSKAVAAVKCPVLIIHGKKDSIIPYTHSETIFKNCTAEPKKLCLLDGLDHNFSPMDFEDYILAPVVEFLRPHKKGPTPRELVFPASVFVKPPKPPSLPEETKTGRKSIISNEKPAVAATPSSSSIATPSSSSIATSSSSSTSSTATPATSLATVSPAREPWDCEACTFQNSGARNRCGICDTPAPVAGQSSFIDNVAFWECSVCTLMNSGVDRYCNICQTRRVSS